MLVQTAGGNLEAWYGVLYSTSFIFVSVCGPVPMAVKMCVANEPHEVSIKNYQVESEPIEGHQPITRCNFAMSMITDMTGMDDQKVTCLIRRPRQNDRFWLERFS